MRRDRFLPVVLFAALGLAAQSGPPGRRPAPTVEPALPLRMEFRVEEVRRSGSGATIRLSFAVEADAAVEDLALVLQRPPADQSAGDVLPPRVSRMAAGEKRLYNLTLSAPHGALLPVSVQAEYRLQDGRIVRSGQGIDVPIDAPPAARPNAGALEFFAVPAGEVGR